MNYFVGFLFLGGSIVIFLAAVGVVKFEDTLLRLHAASKSASLGVILLIWAAALYFRDLDVTLAMVGMTLLLFIKTPVASQAIARAAYFLDDPRLWQSLVLDEWHGQTGPTDEKKGLSSKGQPPEQNSSIRD